jgi:hypothetical protein
VAAELLRALAEKWEGARAAERANFQPYLIGLCQAMGVEPPGPAGSGYEFELPVKVITRDGVEVSNFLDCHRRDFFAIEAKDEEPGRSTEMLLPRAFGQLRHYASHAPGGLPPYPADVISQIGAIKRLLSEEALAAEAIAARFTGAKADLVRRHLEILLVMGEVQLNPDGRYQGTA